MNGSGRAQCMPSIGNLRMFSSKKRRKPYYAEDSGWKEVTWMLTSPSSNRQYAMRGLTKTIHWCSTSSQTGYQQRCTKTSTPTSNPARMKNGDMKHSTNRRNRFPSKRDLIVCAPPPHPHDPYQINGGEHPETTTPWIPPKDVSDHG